MNDEIVRNVRWPVMLNLAGQQMRALAHWDGLVDQKVFTRGHGLHTNKPQPTRATRAVHSGASPGVQGTLSLRQMVYHLFCIAMEQYRREIHLHPSVVRCFIMLRYAYLCSAYLTSQR